MGSAETERWLDALPWQKDGGIRKIVVSRPDLVKRFSEAIRTAVYGRNSGRTDVRLHTFPVQTSSDLLAAVWGRMNIADDGTKYEQLVELARRLEDRPNVFLALNTTPIPGETVDAAETVLDQVEKVGGQVRPTFIFLLTSMLGVRGVPDDFTAGWPIGCEPSNVDQHLSEAWPPYVHQRLAWETAGDILRAERWDTHYKCHQLGLGDDEQFESILNRAAIDTYQDMPTETSRRLEKRLNKAALSGTADDSLWQPWEELRQFGLVWFTPNNYAGGPSPWLARALLLRGIQGPIRSVLRNSLVCAPLARQILTSCFDLEARERARCSGDIPPEANAAGGTWENFNRFTSDEPTSEAEFYPKCCPARPDHVWQFASWGEIIENARPRTPAFRTRLRHDLRTLRNALSHGHYAGWRMICRLKSIQKEFGINVRGYGTA